MFINYYIKSKILILKIKLNLNDEVNNDKIVINTIIQHSIFAKKNINRKLK